MKEYTVPTDICSQRFPFRAKNTAFLGDVAGMPGGLKLRLTDVVTKQPDEDEDLMPDSDEGQQE